MAEGDITYFEECALEIGKGTHDFSADTFKLGLIDSALTPVKSATALWSTFSANEVATGGAYPAGGYTLAGTSWVEINGEAKFDANNIVQSLDAVGFTDARWGIIYNAAAGNAIAFFDLGSGLDETAYDFEIEWSTDGICRVID